MTLIRYSGYMQDRELLIRDKYAGNREVDLSEDLARLERGEPLAYVIGWIPFLGLRIGLDSRPLIPRPETEWWTEELCVHLSERFGDRPFSFLDLCAGSGAIGLAILARFPHAHVTFSEVIPEHSVQIQHNLKRNALDASRATVVSNDLFEALPDKRFDCIATNPPYIPSERTLDSSVTLYEPGKALFSGEDGLVLIRRIAGEVEEYLLPSGELWMECDVTNIEEAQKLLTARTEIRTDLYGRPRVVVGYYK